MHLQTKQTNSDRRTTWLGTLAATFLMSCAADGDIAKPISTGTATPLSKETEFSTFLPASATLRLSARGDIDADGDDDALIVYAPTLAADNTSRTLMLLLRDENGVLHKSIVNPNAILCRSCGGMMGDPLQQISTKRGEFTLRFEGGSRELWSSEYTFKYAGDRGVWKLDEIVFNGFDRADGKTAEKRIEPAEFGDVSLEEFDASAFLADALP
jgi:hypothetical protein